MDKLELKGSNVTIMVSSMAKSVKFYTETLGLELKVRYSSHWAEINAGGLTIGLHPKIKGKNIVQGDNMTIGLQVDNLDEGAAFLKSKGIDVSIQKDSQVQMAYFNDPDGNVLYLFQLKGK
jgi:catechol 2,3-dioxygenase-like lactoylglutathione lyase family enzyme